MRWLLWIGVCLYLWGCSDSENFHRGYVISKSVENEGEAAQAEEADLH